MGCYLKTVGTVQASYVIRKVSRTDLYSRFFCSPLLSSQFLDAQRLSHLTSYLQELHSRGLANSDHTTLLLNCYTKLADDTALSSFIHSSSTSGTKQRLVPLPDTGNSADASEEPPFDLETAIRVCRQAGYFEHAVWLAERYGEHEEYLRIQIEDRADFGDALAYLRRLGTEVAKDSLVRYGKTLLAAEPKATTALLIDLCCGTLSKGKESESTEDKDDVAAKKAETEGKGYMSLLAYGTSAEPSLPPPPPSTSPAPSPLAAGPRSNANDLRTNESAANNRKSGISNQYHVPDSSPPPAPIEEDVPSPRQFFAHYVDHPHDFITFLETIAERRYGKKVDAGTEATPSNAPLPKPQPLRALEFDDAATRDEQAIWNTLLELYVSHGSAGPGDHSEVVLQGKALRLLRARERIPYDETQALLVCSTQGFVPGFILLYEQLGMYDDIVRCELALSPLAHPFADPVDRFADWIDSSQASSSTSSDSSKVIQALHRYGPSHPHLYRMVLRYLTTSSELLSRHQSEITDILDDIDRDKILPPIAVVQILSTNGTASIGLVREYLKKQLTAEKQEIDSVRPLSSRGAHLHRSDPLVNL
jgi:vacuolar protein sorting-associated protein 11